MRIARQLGMEMRFTRGCLAGTAYCCILPSGEVHPCPYLPATVGVDKLTATDRELLNLIQTDFPRTARPFADIGIQLGLTEAEVLKRVQALKADGLIRRIGGIFDSQKMGFASTLVALQVEEARLEEVAEAVSSHIGVTHNYERRHQFNLWFTLVAPSDEQLQQILSEVKKQPGVVALRNLPAVRFFKIGVNFDMKEGGR